MKIKSFGKMLLSLAFLVFISTFAASGIYGQKCSESSSTDEAIVNTIYTKIKGNSNLSSQVSHINVTSTNSVVKIYGWVNNKSDYDKVIDYAVETDCVKLINVNAFSETKPAEEQLKANCSPGTKPCFDICIPQDDTCNITKP